MQTTYNPELNRKRVKEATLDTMGRLTLNVISGEDFKTLKILYQLTINPSIHIGLTNIIVQLEKISSNLNPPSDNLKFTTLKNGTNDLATAVREAEGSGEFTENAIILAMMYFSLVLTDVSLSK